jgi:cytochrome oxidase Cu insertion factor (SCO1/SenC/PrrC family)
LAASAIQKTADGKVEVSHTATAYIIDESGLVVDELPFGVGSDGFENDLKILLREIEQS